MSPMELRPPDMENLADHRMPCPNFETHGDTNLADDCVLCEGKNEVIVPTGRGRLSHTSLSMQLACLRKFGWAYVERLELISKPEALSMGSAFHKALEEGDPTVGVNLMLEREPGDQEEADKLKIQAATVGAAAALYLATYRQDLVGDWGGIPIRADPALEPGEVAVAQRELEYLIRLRNPATGAYSRTFDLYGYADGVIDHGDYLELVEDKFVGRIDAISTKKVKLDRQVSLECYALWRITGKPVKIIRYRFTKKPSIKVRQNETVDEFVQRLHEDYAARPDFYTHEERTTRDADDLLLTEAELWDWAEQRRDAGHRNFYARNTSHCNDFGGCAFIDLCAGDPDAMSLYRRRPERLIQLEDRG